MKISRLRLFVEGFNQLRLLSHLTKDGIKIYELNKESACKMSFVIAKKDSQKTFAILEKMCYTYSVKERTDINFMLSSAAARAGLIAGLIIFSMLLTLSYGFIWRIKIEGNEKVDTLTIERALKSYGISPGKTKKNINKNGVRDVVNSIDEILESSVEIYGTTIRISVVETADFVEPEKDKFADILSNYDATVTRLITTAGETQVSRGQHVFKGAVLIGAFRTDSEGNKIPTSAKGQVFGEVTFSKTIEFSTKEYILERTGKTYTSTEYSIFNGKIKGKQKHNFLLCETVTTNINVFDNFFVPLKAKQTVFYELEEAEITYDENERSEYYKSLFINDTVIAAGGQEIKSSHTLTQVSENKFKLTIYVQAEILIGQD